MKTFPAFAIISAVVAFVVYWCTFEASISVLFAAGLAAIAIGDYRRPARPLAAARIPANSRAQRLQLAA